MSDVHCSVSVRHRLLEASNAPGVLGQRTFSHAESLYFGYKSQDSLDDGRDLICTVYAVLDGTNVRAWGHAIRVDVRDTRVLMPLVVGGAIDRSYHQASGATSSPQERWTMTRPSMCVRIHSESVVVFKARLGGECCVMTL